jgi:delta24(24(1))-sterol reductase
MTSTTLRKRTANGSAISSANSNGHAKQEIVDVDGIHHEYEFGGPLGVTAMMTFFPSLFYYLYVCLFFYDGRSSYPGGGVKCGTAGMDAGTSA